jgi:fibronectin-binding autotransporter adhesin
MKSRSLIFTSAILVMTVPLASADNRWTGTTSGDWNTATNWSTGAAPNPTGTNVDVIFNSAGLNPAVTLSAITNIRTLFLYGGNYTLGPAVSPVLTWSDTGGFSQLGSGTFAVSNTITAAGNLTFNGTGTGAITLSGPITSTNTWDKFNQSDVSLTSTFTTTSTSGNALRVRAGNLLLSGSGSVTLGANAQIGIGFSTVYQVARFHDTSGATIVLDNTGTNNLDRISDRQINFSQRGLLELRGNASAASSETLGILNASGPGMRLRVDPGSGQSARLTFSSLQVNNAVGNTTDTNSNPVLVQYAVPSGDTLGVAGTTGGRVIFTTPPSTNDGVLRYGVIVDDAGVSAPNFATYDITADNGAALGVKAFSAYTTTDLDAAVATNTVDASGSITLTDNRECSALRLTPTGPGEALDLDGLALKLSGAGGFIFGGGNDYAINDTGGPGVDSFVATNFFINSNNLTITKLVKNNELTKAGNGMLVISDIFTNNSARHLGVDDGAGSGDDMQISGILLGSQPVRKAGLGTLALTGSTDNSGFTGSGVGADGFTIFAGTLVLAKDSAELQDVALGSERVTLDGGTLAARGFPAVLANTITIGTVGSGQFGNRIAGDQAITFSGLFQGITGSGQTYALVNSSSATLTLSGTIQGFNSGNGSNQSSTMAFAGDGNTNLSGTIRNTDPTFVGAGIQTTAIQKNGSGLMIISGANTYTGQTTINGGYLRLDNATAAGPLATTGRIEIAETIDQIGNNAVLELGTGNTTFTRATGTAATQVRIGGNNTNMPSHAGFASVTGTSTINLGGALAAVTWGAGAGFFNVGGDFLFGSPNVAGTVDFQNPMNLGNGSTSNVTRTFRALNGSAAVDGIISGAIADATTTGTNNGITKSGAGTLALTAANTYTGATSVTAGTLLVNNTTGTGTGTGAVSVASGATLGGTGSIGGAVTVSTGGIIAPGASAGTLTVGGNTTIGGTYACEVNGLTKDVLAVTGDLNLTGSTLAVSTPGAGATETSYVIATYTGARTGSFTISPALPAGYTVDYATAGQVKLVSAVTASYATWAAAFSSPALSNTASTADPDSDGLTNAVEYALGLDPRFSSPSPGVYSGTTLTFTKGAEAKVNGDVIYQIETSTTLGVAPSPWTVDVVNVTNGANTIAITFPSGPVKNFARLKVTLVP